MLPSVDDLDFHLSVVDIVKGLTSDTLLYLGVSTHLRLSGLRHLGTLNLCLYYSIIRHGYQDVFLDV